mmetsp:Transcript_11088/g.32969  ORF Transcript_11088/g.32969 Transcript_11088/m.32969 type:complete len:202 (+) Transcript_11088:1231-1836(+)
MCRFSLSKHRLFPAFCGSRGGDLNQATTTKHKLPTALLHRRNASLDLVHRNRRFVACEVGARPQEEHAMALLSLPHGHTWAVPEALVRLRVLVVVVPAGTQRGSQRVLVLRETLDDDRGNGLVHAEDSVAPLGVLLGELAHHLERVRLGRLGGRRHIVRAHNQVRSAARRRPHGTGARGGGAGEDGHREGCTAGKSRRRLH